MEEKRDLNLQASRIAAATEDFREEIFSFLKSAVDINSHSSNPDGINRIGEMVVDLMPDSLGHRVVVDRNGVNHHLFSNCSENGSPVVLVGHLDTVFPPDSPFQKFSDLGNRFQGPGVADMKGGIAVLVFALRVLDGLGCLSDIPVRCMINGDEETGSPYSEALIREMAQGAACGLVFECGGLQGEIVNLRRGIRRYKLKVTGQARHAGVKGGPKASALVELSRMVLALEDLNNIDAEISVNVGRMSGGMVTNIVPDYAEAYFETRFWDMEAEKQAVGRIEELAEKAMTPGCSVELRCHHRRPASRTVDGQDALLTLVSESADDLGQAARFEKRGGTSDMNFLTDEGVPALDGLGPVGDKDHTHDEFIFKESLMERTALTALTLANFQRRSRDFSP
ncbi:MAG: M20 family metallopeptidase [Deltaproteobacteria bacterium]|nr:M20 family metallopeptidase [Deltaproteobacteria bacterium]